MWQLKHAEERCIRKTADTVCSLPWSSLPGAAVTVSGHSEMEQMRQSLIATNVAAHYGQGQFTITSSDTRFQNVLQILHLRSFLIIASNDLPNNILGVRIPMVHA